MLITDCWAIAVLAQNVIVMTAIRIVAMHMIVALKDSRVNN